MLPDKHNDMKRDTIAQVATVGQKRIEEQWKKGRRTELDGSFSYPTNEDANRRRSNDK